MMPNTNSDPPCLSGQCLKPTFKLYLCPADADPIQLEGFVGTEVPTSITEALHDFLLKVEEGDGFADLHLSTIPWKNGQKYQTRWKTAVSKQGYFDKATFDSVFLLFEGAVRPSETCVLDTRRLHNLVE